MSGEVAGYSCPTCKTTRPIYVQIIMGIMDESHTPVAYDLTCGCCGQEWRVIL